MTKEEILGLSLTQLPQEILKLYPRLVGTRPAHDITGAMAVFEILRKSGDWCCLTICSDYSYLWEVKLIREGKNAHEPVICVLSSEEGLAPTICRAVLLADLYIKEENK